MKLESAADRLYRDKTSEIEKKYYISRDKVYLYFDDYDVELLVNDELYKGNIHDAEKYMSELRQALTDKHKKLSDKNKQYDYKTYVFTNSMLRASKLLQLNHENTEFIFAKAGKHTKGQLFKAVCRELPFIICNINSLACNKIDQVKAEGVYKIKKVIEFNCNISGQDLHHLGQTIGRNIEKMEGQIVRESRKKDGSFYLPRLFSFKAMKRTQWEGQVVRNYNLLQCANMSGLLQFDPDNAFKVIPNVISFDIKTAYLSVMINEPIFPFDLTVIDIDPQEDIVDVFGHHEKNTPYHVAFDIMAKLDRFEEKGQWYYLAIDPCYAGDDPTVKYYLHMLKPFRRNFKNHPETTLKYVNQDQVIGFLQWDKYFYDEYYGHYTELLFSEMLYNLLLMCPDSKIVLMYSKQPSDYLPEKFRQSKMELYQQKEDQEPGSIERDITKLYTELTYGKGLQLRNFQSDDEARKAITNETINIAQSLTCCSYTRYRLIHDWNGFIPLYMDSDSVKFQFGADSNNLAALMQRHAELEKINKQINTDAGFKNSNLGSWNVDGVYDYMLFMKKKCYIGYKNDATVDLATAGCDSEAAAEYFKDATLNLLREIERTGSLTIPKGKRKKSLIPNNEFEYDDPRKSEAVTYSK